MLHKEYAPFVIERPWNCHGDSDIICACGITNESPDSHLEGSGDLFAAAIGVYRNFPSVGAFYESTADVKEQNILQHSSITCVF